MAELRIGSITDKRPMDPTESRFYKAELAGMVCVTPRPNGKVDIKVNLVGDPSWEQVMTYENVDPAAFALALLKEAGPLTSDQKLALLEAINAKKPS